MENRCTVIVHREKGVNSEQGSIKWSYGVQRERDRDNLVEWGGRKFSSKQAGKVQSTSHQKCKA